MNAIVGGLFVWVKGQRGPYAEKWPLDKPHNKTGGAGAPVVLREYRLSPDEFALRIAVLEQRYPAPPKEEWPKEELK